MSRTTTARLKNAVRRLNFALEIVQHAKGEYIVAQIRTNNRVRWALQRDYATGPVAVTGYRPAGDILRHIEAMLDGIAAARGLPVPRSMYDGFIKRDQPAAVTSRGLKTADGEPSQVVLWNAARLALLQARRDGVLPVRDPCR